MARSAIQIIISNWSLSSIASKIKLNTKRCRPTESIKKMDSYVHVSHLFI